MASIFSDVKMGPAIEVFALTRRFNEDPSPNKVNLGVGGKVDITQELSFQFLNCTCLSPALRKACMTALKLQMKGSEGRFNLITTPLYGIFIPYHLFEIM